MANPLGKLIVLTEYGLLIRAEKEHLVVEKEGEYMRDIPLADLSELICVGKVEFTASAILRCLKHGVRVSFVSRTGRYLGRLYGPLKRNAELRIKQYKTIIDEGRMLSIAKAIIEAKMKSQRALLLRRQRELQDPDIAQVLVRMRHVIESLDQVRDLEETRGIEGSCSAMYFSVFGRLITNPLFTFAGRNRRPPRDPINAMLSFGYTIVGGIIEGDIEAAGLDPSLGCLHVPEYGRPSLALDILEEFRTPLVDSVVLRLVNRKQVNPADFGPPNEIIEEDEEDDYEQADEGLVETVIPALAKEEEDEDKKRSLKGAVYMKPSGKKVFISALLSRLRERVYDTELDGYYEFRGIIRNQVYRMARAFADPSVKYKGYFYKL